MRGVFSLLRTTTYQISSPKIPDTFHHFRIAHLSDLHGAVYGKNQKILLDTIKRAKPNIIVMTGDMADSTANAIEIALSVCKQLRTCYPIYYIIGNHEQTLKQTDYQYLLNKLRSIGVILLENSYCKIIKGNASILLYGLRTPYIYYNDILREHQRGIYLSVTMMKKLLGTPPKDKYCILLAHHPLYFPSYHNWGADLTLSGHMHGGIIRLPKLRGLFSPDLSFFPKYDWGHFEEEGKHMIISSGLGNHFLVRIMNPPEVVIVDLIQE